MITSQVLFKTANHLKAPAANMQGVRILQLNADYQKPFLREC